MKCKSLRFTACLLIATLICGYLSNSASAVPVSASYVDLSACDNHGSQLLKHELGDASVFPIDEAIIVSAVLAPDPGHFTCASDNGQIDEWRVQITNISPYDYRDLFFVVDAGLGFSNVDGLIEDLANPGFTEAFKIDGTVTPGVNNALVFESGPVDEVFQSGETWEFLVTNFDGTPFSPAPLFNSPGGFSLSSGGGPPSNASIVANLVPEPASLGLLLIGGCAIFGRRRAAQISR